MNRNNCATLQISLKVKYYIDNSPKVKYNIITTRTTETDFQKSKPFALCLTERRLCLIVTRNFDYSTDRRICQQILRNTSREIPVKFPLFSQRKEKDMKQEKGPAYQVNANFVLQQVYITIPLSDLGWSKLEESRAWKDLLTYLAEVQTEDWILNPQSPRSLLEIPGYIDDDRALGRCLQCAGTIRRFLNPFRRKCIGCPIEVKRHISKSKDSIDLSPAKRSQDRR